MGKKILHIDMDGVICRFDEGVRILSPETDTKNYSKEVDEICRNNPYIFHYLKPLKDAVPSVKELFNHFDVYFLSTPMWHVPLSYIGKRLWIEEHFGNLSEKRLILTHRKDLVIGDYLVDDTTRNGVAEFKGEHIHFGSEKFPDWKSTLEYLKTKHHGNTISN